jgi:hypothetical protein
MKRTIWFGVLMALLGIWAGFRAWSSPSLALTIQAGCAIFLGGNLIFFAWICLRARPGSGERLLLPDIMLLQIGMLIGLVPRLWPASDGVQIAASITSAVMAFVVFFWVRRKFRKLVKERLG